jgi:hypothetical protein
VLAVMDLPSFTQNLIQAHCLILPSIAVWYHMADWCNRLVEVWPWPPLSSFTEAVTTVMVWELSDSTFYKSNHSPPSSAKIKIAWIYYFTPPCLLWHDA